MLPWDTVLGRPFASLVKVLYNPQAFFTHAALLDQAFAHCPIFPTAASRRSLGRVSVPVWLIILSDQLSIVALVGLYPTNKLIEHRLILSREARRSPALVLRRYAVLAKLSLGYPPRQGRFRCITHPSATRLDRSPLAFDLHVLSMPPAFNLSQDQTLQFKSSFFRTRMNLTKGITSSCKSLSLRDFLIQSAHTRHFFCLSKIRPEGLLIHPGSSPVSRT